MCESTLQQHGNGEDMAKKTVTFGEIMLRLAPEGDTRFVQAESYGATYGGGEANVAVSLANFGSPMTFPAFSLLQSLFR